MTPEQPTRPCSKCRGTGLEVDPVATGLLLKTRRVEARKTLRGVAARMNRSASYVSDLERGNRSFNAQLITEYLEALQ